MSAPAVSNLTNPVGYTVLPSNPYFTVPVGNHRVTGYIVISTSDALTQEAFGYISITNATSADQTTAYVSIPVGISSISIPFVFVINAATVRNIYMTVGCYILNGGVAEPIDANINDGVVILTPVTTTTTTFLNQLESIGTPISMYTSTTLPPVANRIPLSFPAGSTGQNMTLDLANRTLTLPSGTGYVEYVVAVEYNLSTAGNVTVYLDIWNLSTGNLVKTETLYLNPNSSKNGLYRCFSVFTLSSSNHTFCVSMRTSVSLTLTNFKIDHMHHSILQ
jgi:hypothetical protein